MEERVELEKNTQRPFEGSDPQSERAREEYARSQMQMRQWNKELNEFAEMRKFYAERKEEAPYKTLGAFRRAYRSEQGSLAYARSHYMRRDAREYESFAKVIGKERLPETLAKFQEMKYNKKEQEKYQALIEEKVQEKDYLEAASGGKHHGKLDDFSKNQSIKQLEKTIRSYDKTIEEHLQKIADPLSFYPNWGTFDERQQAGYIKKWRKDIQRNTQERNIAIGLLKRRIKQNEDV